MSSTIGFPTVPNTLAIARAVSTSFATVTTTTTTTVTNTVFEAVHSTLHTTLTATATAASMPSSSNLGSKIPAALLKNVTAAYTAAHRQALQAGTARYALAEQLPVLNWVLLGVLGTGAGLHLIRRYRKKTPPVPIPLGQDAERWRMIARGMTTWLQQALRNNAVLRQDLRRAQQAAEDTRQGLDRAQEEVVEAVQELRGALQQAQELKKAQEHNDEERTKLRQDLQKEQESVTEFRQHIQHAEELEKMQDEELEASREREVELQHKLNEEITRRKQLELEAARPSLPKLETKDATTSASRPSVRFSPGINASPLQVPSSIDRSSSIGTPIPWAPLGNVYPSSAKRRVTPQQNYGGVYSSIERILQRDALIENTPTFKRKRSQQNDGDEETRRPAKLHRSSPLEAQHDTTDTPKGTPPASLYFWSKGKQKVDLNVGLPLWGVDGLPSIRLDQRKPLQASVEPDDSIADKNMPDSGVIDNSMPEITVQTIETADSAYATRSPSRARSRLPVPSKGSPERRSTRAATRNMQSLNELDLANRSTCLEEDDREATLHTMGRKQRSKTPTQDSIQGDHKPRTRKVNDMKSPTRQTRSMSPAKGRMKDPLTSPIKKNGQGNSKSLASPQKK